MPQLHDYVWQNGLVVDKICRNEVLLAMDNRAVLVQRPVPFATHVCAALRIRCSFQKFACSRRLFIDVPVVSLRLDQFPIRGRAPPSLQQRATVQVQEVSCTAVLSVAALLLCLAIL